MTDTDTIRDYVPVPCPIHGRHDLTPLAAARVIVVINEQSAELAAGADWEYDPDRDQCVDNLNRLSRDSEGFQEHVELLMESIGVDNATWGDRPGEEPARDRQRNRQDPVRMDGSDGPPSQSIAVRADLEPDPED